MSAILIVLLIAALSGPSVGGPDILIEDSIWHGPAEPAVLYIDGPVEPRMWEV